MLLKSEEERNLKVGDIMKALEEIKTASSNAKGGYNFLPIGPG